MTFIRIAALVLGLGLVLWRLRRGWETWGHLLQMMLGVAALSAALSEGRTAPSILGGLGVGVMAGFAYLHARPTTRPPERGPVREEWATPEQKRLAQRVQRLLPVGAVTFIAGEVTLAILYVLDVLSLGWSIVLAVVMLLPVVAANLIYHPAPCNRPSIRSPKVTELFPMPHRF